MEDGEAPAALRRHRLHDEIGLVAPAAQLGPHEGCVHQRLPLGGALALVEHFDIPPENLVLQGYGEEFLQVPTEAAEAENRRALFRRITALLDEVDASLQ